MVLPNDKLCTLAEYLSGTPDSVQRGLERIGLNPDDWDTSEIEHQLLDVNLERCQGCDWWMESGELVDSDTEESGYCQDCR